MIEMSEPITEFKLESPGGLVQVKAECSEGSVKNVHLQSMPSFVLYQDVSVFVDSLGTIHKPCGQNEERWKNNGPKVSQK